MCCTICGIPQDAEYFDVSGTVPFDVNFQPGDQKVLTSFQLHPQYCGVLTYFAQFTDVYAKDNSQIATTGFDWVITQNGRPLFPYVKLDLIVNPWGMNCLEVAVRLDENARVEMIIRNLSATTTDPKPVITKFAGRLMGRYWYNETFGGRNPRWRA
jgi:hypothetical protein